MEKESWEKRSVRFVLKTAGVLLFLAYLILTGGSAWTWMKAKWVRLQPVEAAAAVAENYLRRKPDPEKLATWIKLRPLTETDTLIKELDSYAAEMPPAAFFAYSKKLSAMGRMDEALFWSQYARFRLRFDTLRCGSREAIDTMANILDQLPDRRLQAFLDSRPELEPQSLRQVLDYDEKHPARNDPADLCKTLNRMSRENITPPPSEEWDSIRKNFRFAAEVHLQEMRSK